MYNNGNDGHFLFNGGGINSRNEMKMRSKTWATCKWKNLNIEIMGSSPQGSSGSL